MKILLTNDDGVFAPGIRALAANLCDLGEVVVAAPSLEQSGSSQAITVHEPIRVDPYVMEGLPVAAWSIGGTPADCVKLALAALVTEIPDLVISGVNAGPNLGSDVLYSGTVSAGREGAMHGILSVAVSLDAFDSPDFDAAARFARFFVAELAAKALPNGSLLNVNVPCGWQYGGAWRYTRLGVRKYDNTFERCVDPRGRTYYWMGGRPAEAENAPDTDVAAVAAGAVSVTPLHFDLTDRRLLAQL